MGFIWGYSHEDLLQGELSQQQVSLKSKIPTSDQMTQVDKEAEIQKAITKKRRAAIERKNVIMIEDEEESSSYSSMSMYNLDSDKEDSYVPSHRSPTLILQDAPLLMHLEEVHSSLVTENIPSERHSVIQEEEHPSRYNIEEIFNSFMFNLYKKEVSGKRLRNEKHNDGIMKEI